MSRILAKYIIDKQQWTVENKKVEPLQTFLAVNFETDNELQNFKYGYEIYEDGELKQMEGFPPLGTKYKKTDLAYLDEHQTMLKYNSEYKIILWAENDGERITHVHEFVCPEPIPPYPSWTWDGEKHVPPTPDPTKPGDVENVYVWNEDSQEWELDKSDLMKKILGVKEGPIE